MEAKLMSQENINESVKVEVRKILSEVEDLDYAKAVSELNLKLTGLQASQKAFSRVQDLSLFDFIWSFVIIYFCFRNVGYHEYLMMGGYIDWLMLGGCIAGS